MSQLNRNASYLYIVDGYTIWERLRVIRNFLEDRKQSLEVSKAKQKDTAKKKETLDKDSFEYAEIEIFEPQTKRLIEECENEIAFLAELETKLSVEAEKTRIDGKTDDEMYEFNYFNELVQIQLMDVKSEIMALGHVSPNTMKTLLRNPNTMQEAVKLGLLNKQVLELARKVNEATPLLLEGKDA